VAKSKKERRSSIRHMATDDAFTVLEALERAAQQEPAAATDAAAADGADELDDEELPEPASAER
jgi:hypothetical protein